MSEFEDFIRSQGFGGDFQRGCNGQYKSDLLHFMEKAFMHQQAKINQLKAKNTQLTHALVNANAEKSKWQKDYWSQVERSAEYGAMLMTDPDSLEFKCYQKEKKNEELTKQLTLCREENKGLVGSLNEQRQINIALNSETIKQREQIQHYMGKCVEQKKHIDEGLGLIKSLYKSEFSQRSNPSIHISQIREIEKALRGES